MIGDGVNESFAKTSEKSDDGDGGGDGDDGGKKDSACYKTNLARHGLSSVSW